MELTDLIQRIDRLKVEIDKLRPLDRDIEGRIMQKFRLDWNYHSSNIEGNSLTFGETKVFLLHGLTAEGKPLKDHLEIKGHNEAIIGLDEIVSGEHPLTEHEIKSLHQVILGKPYQIPARTVDGLPTQRQVVPGRYKIEPNHVVTATGEIFYFATPEETPAQMEDLMKWYHSAIADTSFHPLMLAATFHYKFIRIHPFDDGNGRIARILMNLVLMMRGYPPAIIRTEEREDYYRALRQADGGDIEIFIKYVAEQLLHSLQLYLRGAHGEDIEQDEDIDKRIALFKAELDRGNIIQRKRNRETIALVMENAIVPLLEKIDNTLRGFDELFMEKRFRFIKRGEFNGWDVRGVHKNVVPASPESQEYYSFEELRQGIRDSDWEGVAAIKITYTWQGFRRNATNTFDYPTNVEVIFTDYNYILNQDYSNRTLFTKLYHEKFSEEESTLIAKELADSMLENLPRYIRSSD